MKRSLLTVAAALLALGTVFPLPSAACPEPVTGGGRRIPWQDEMGASLAVIVGKAEGKRELHEKASDPGAVTAILVRVRIDQLLQGNVPGEIDIREESGSDSLDFHPGRQYLLFVQRQGPRWRLPLGDAYYVDACGNSGPVAERADILREFGVNTTWSPRAQLAKSLQAWSGSDATIHFLYVLVDLNDDGLADALALMTGPEYCAGGGCRLVVLAGEPDGSFRAVSASTVTREPISLLPKRSHGWHALVASVAGGAVGHCRVRLDYDGARYPANATLAPCVTEDELLVAAPLTLAP